MKVRMRSLIGSGCGVGGVASVLIPARRTPSIRAERASDNRSVRAGSVRRVSDTCISSGGVPAEGLWKVPEESSLRMRTGFRRPV
jgi:hypothetical protein